MSMYYVSQIFFYGIPAAILVFFAVSLYRYLNARKRNKIQPGTVPEDEMSWRKMILVISSVILGILLVIVVGLAVLLYMAVAYM